MAGEVAEDVDAVGTDALRQLVMGHPLHVRPDIGRRLHATAQVVGRAVGVAMHLHLVAVAMLEEEDGEITHRMTAEVRRHQPQAQPPVGVAGVAVGTPFGTQRRTVAALPPGVQVKQARRRDPGAVLLAIEKVGMLRPAVLLGRHGVFEGGHRVFQPAQLHQRDAQVVVGVGEVGIEGDDASVGADGVAQSALGLERIAQVAPGLGVAGPEVDGAAVGLDGPIQVAAVLQRVAQVVVRFRIIGADGQRPAVGGDGVRRPALFAQDDAQVVVGLGEIPFQGYGPGAGVGRGLQLAQLLERAAQIAVGLGVARSEADGAPVFNRSLVHATSIAQRVAQVVVGLRILRVEGDGLAVVRHRRPGIPLLPEDVTQVVVGLGVAGPQRDGLAARPRRLVPAAQPHEGVAQVVVRLGVVGPMAEGLADEGDGDLVVPRLMGDDAEQVQGLRVLRLGCQDFPVGCLGLGQAAGLMVREGPFEPLRPGLLLFLLAASEFAVHQFSPGR